MKPLSLNLSKMKKIAGDDKSSTFMHPSGHQMVIAHSGVSALQRKQLEKMPVEHLADGGMTGPEAMADAYDQALDDPSPQATQVPVPGDSQGSAYGQAYNQDIHAGPNQDDTVKSSASSISPAAELGEPSGPAQQPEAPKPGIFDASNQMQLDALQEQRSGMKDMAQAQGDLGAQQAEIEKQSQITQKAAQDKYNASMAILDQQSNKLQEAVSEGRVDPKRFVQHMQTGDRISNALGLIFGGMGSATSGGPNLAYDELQKNIERDVESQKIDIGKNENLLSHNLQQTQNLRAATDLTRLQNYEMVQSQLRQQSAMAATPIAQAQLKVNDGLLSAKIAELKHNFALTSGVQGAFNGKGNGISLEMLPADMRERAVQLPGGGMRLAITKDGAKEVREQVQTITPIFQALDRLKALGPSALIPGTPEYQSAKSIQSQLIPEVNSNAGLKRLSGEDIQNIKQMFSDPTQFSGLISGARTATFKQFLQDKLLSTMGSQLEGGGGQRQQAGKINFKPRSS